MVIKKVRVRECLDGSVLAEDIINDIGVILVAKDTVLNQYIKERIMDYKVETIFIYQPHQSLGCTKDDIAIKRMEENYINVILHTKKILQDLTAGKPLNYENVSYLSNQIQMNLSENKSIVDILLNMKDYDDYTYRHSVNVAYYSMLIAKWMDLPEDDINKAIQSGLLHDIGKTRIPDTILNKAGALTDDEYNIMKQHTVLGYEIVKDNEAIHHDIKAAILLHHERVDGSGYPFCYTADKINIFTKIVALADVFDAMTSNRVYKKRSTPFEVFDMYQTIGMCLFDTKLLYVFLRHLAVCLVGAKVLLSNGDRGEIVYIPLHDLTSPIVKVQSVYLDISREPSVHILSMV